MLQLFLEPSQCLLDQISEKWPEPYPGVIEFVRNLENMRHYDHIPIGLAILSSGHASFIAKTFECWNLPPPKFVVTDDDIRHRQRPSLEARIKPSPFPFRLLQCKWLKSFNDQEKGWQREVIYFGDDIKKDGGLAININIPFGFFNPDNKNVCLRQFLKGSFSLESWEELNTFLEKIETRTQFFIGKTLSEIFSKF